MNVRKYRWSKHYESAEEELTNLLAARNIEAERWTANEMEVLDSRVFAEDHQLWCAEGSIIFTIEGQRVSIQPGDTLEIPANMPHDAIAGISGCVCYEYPASK
jgi:quercetin dioxygenase-like cupin family protein